MSLLTPPRILCWAEPLGFRAAPGSCRKPTRFMRAGAVILRSPVGSARWHPPPKPRSAQWISVRHLRDNHSFPLDAVGLPPDSGAVAFVALSGDSLFPETFTAVLTILSPQAPSGGFAEHSIFVPLHIGSIRQDHAPHICRRPHNSPRSFGCQKSKAVPRCKRDNSQEGESQEEHSSVNLLRMSSGGHRCGGELQNQLAVLSEQITRHEF